MSSKPCPCGTTLPYAQCCEPFHLGKLPATAQELMRSRYTAFTTGNTSYLLRTWDPRTRPRELELDASITWKQLEILRTLRGEATDTLGMVHFRAHYTYTNQAGHTQTGMQEERSKFTRADTADQWLYLE